MAFTYQEIKKQVNQVGQSYSITSERFSFVDFERSQGHVLIKIKNKKSGKVKVSTLNNLKSGKNPFRQFPIRHEETIVHPKVKSFLKKLGLKVESEVWISKNSRVDFLVTTKKGRKVIIEVKSDKKKHTKNDLTEQISRYQTDGKKKFGNLYAKTFLVSLNGRYGLTLKEMALQMKQMGLA